MTEVNEYPWMVGILFRDNPKRKCGASLISTRWLVSAAHCFKNRAVEDIEAVLGEHDYSTNNETELVRMGIAEIVNHPDYDPRKKNIDLSLLKMKNTIDFSAYPLIRPVCLPTDPSHDYTAYTATVTGWGRLSSSGSVSNTLQEVNVKVLANQVCSYNYKHLHYAITRHMLCANVEGGGKDACDGDSGNNTALILGIKW